MFSNKNILVGITGGIAVYKIAGLVREFKKMNANVRVMMTNAATKFVAPLTFETLSENPVLLDIFPEQGGSGTAHIDWARWADVIVIAPATANSIGKIANGIADNALTTTLLATSAPVVLCPAMNKQMYKNDIFQSNLTKLKNLNFHIVDPGVGTLACGEEGWGRLAEIDIIVDGVKNILVKTRDFTGKRVLVTAGPTEEPLDPVRYISNRSSGKMGYAIAERASVRGADVTLVSGPGVLQCSDAVKCIKIRTAVEMYNAIIEQYNDIDILIMAAAVSDFRPKTVSSEKIKKAATQPKIDLVENPDILKQFAEKKDHRVHVGFAVETTNEIEHAVKKIKSKNLDFIIVNNPLNKGAGFQTDTNQVTIIDPKGNIKEYPLMSKHALADIILDLIIETKRI